MNALLSQCSLIVVSLAFAPALHASGTCGEEVKLLLAPVQAQSAASSLNAARRQHSQIYFYDTPQLDLLAKGLILRIRQGAQEDLTVKLRPATELQFSARAASDENFKCEGELTKGVDVLSYSTTIDFHASSVPQTGEDFRALLSKGQRELLKASGIVVDWSTVRRVIDIQSTLWTIKSKSSQLNKLSLELWEWPEGKTLELSTKVATSEGSAAFDELKNVAKRNHLDLSSDQRAKTSTALGSLAK